MNRRDLFRTFTVAASGIIVPKLIGRIYQPGRGVRVQGFRYAFTHHSGFNPPQIGSPFMVNGFRPTMYVTAIGPDWIEFDTRVLK